MAVDQYGQIYLKNKMVKFVIDKNVQFEAIIIIVKLRLSLWGRQCSLQTELHYTIHSFIQWQIVSKTAIVQCKCHYKLNHAK